jgi:hypothetical protein
MLLNLSYLEFHFGPKGTCSLVLALRNLYHVLVANVIVLTKGTDIMAGNLSLNMRSNIFYVRLFSLCII